MHVPFVPFAMKHKHLKFGENFKWIPRLGIGKWAQLGEGLAQEYMFLSGMIVVAKVYTVTIVCSGRAFYC